MKKSSLSIVLAIVAALCLAGVIFLSLNFASNSLQLDFSAFYTAGEAVNHGFSPYNNNINQNPSIWDGRNQYEFSRFLYPPLTATLFRGIALLPYAIAKYFWVAFILACLVAATFVFYRVFTQNRAFKVNWAIVIICTCLFFPLLPFIERGQIDSFTFLVLCVAFYLMLNKERKGPYAGLLFALATLLKLNCIFLVPFFLLRKRFDVLLGYTVGGVLLILASVVFNGFDTTVHYVTTDFPRISMYGEDGYADKIFPSDRYPAGDLDTYSVKQGIVYSVSLQGFNGKPNLVQPVEGLFGNTNDSGDLVGRTNKDAPTMSVVSLVIFGVIFAIILIRETLLFRSKKAYRVYDEFAFWQLALLVILLASPLTWVMNLIWLCPLVFYALYYFRHRSELNNRQSFYWLVTGLLLVGLPDRVNFPFTLFDSEMNMVVNILVNCFWANKYQIGMIMLAMFFFVNYLKPLKKPVLSTGGLSEDGATAAPVVEVAPSPKISQQAPSESEPILRQEVQTRFINEV